MKDGQDLETKEERKKNKIQNFNNFIRSVMQDA